MIHTLVAALARFAEGKPLPLAFSGAVTGFATLFVTWGETLNLIFKLIGGFFGAACTAAAFLFLLPRLIRFVQRWRERGLINADKE